MMSKYRRKKGEKIRDTKNDFLGVLSQLVVFQALCPIRRYVSLGVLSLGVMSVRRFVSLGVMSLVVMSFRRYVFRRYVFQALCLQAFCTNTKYRLTYTM